MKKLINKFKRGFTIVELVVVIAVIAILAAVLIPTLVNVINQAEESNDIVLVNNLNTIVSSYGTVGEIDKVTMSDGKTVYNVTTALTAADANGYDVSKLTPTSESGDIVYNASTNRFIYYADDFSELAYGDEPGIDDVLVVIDSNLSRVGVAEAQGLTVQYCVYSETNASISTASDITIWLYTASSTTTIDAANAAVYHFGSGDYVYVSAVASSSYHLYGTFDMVYAVKGHIDTTNASLKGVFIPSSSINDIKVDINTNTIIYTDADSITFTGKTTTNTVAVNINGGNAEVDTAIYSGILQLADEINDSSMVSITRTEATCEENGSIVYTDASGNISATIIIPATGHSYGEIEYSDPQVSVNNTEKTYTSTNYIVTYTTAQKCSVCGNEETTECVEDETGNNWGWTYIYSNSNGNQFTVTQYSGDITDITIPDGTTAIQDADWYTSAAFYGKSITSVAIPDSVTSIGAYAFYQCKNLTKVTVSGNVTSIGKNAFYECTSLTSVTFDGTSKLESIGVSAFSGCSSLTSIVIPDSVTTINSSAFYGCSSLTSVTIGTGVTSIGSSAFKNCKALTEINYNAAQVTDLTSGNEVFYCAGQSGTGIKVTIGANVTKIPDYLFKPHNKAPYDSSKDCYITSVVFDEGSVCTSIGQWAFECAKITSIDLPSSLVTIGYRAFQYTSLTSVVIPDNVTSIGQYAFSNCTSLESVTLGKNVSSITDSFTSCTKLASINVDDNNSTYKSIDGNLYSKDGTTLIAYAVGKTSTSFTIPEGVTTIGSSAVSGVSTLTSISIASTVTTIESSAFEECKGLTSIVIPNNVTSIGEKAFYNCTAATSLSIGTGVTEIGKSAFAYCSKIASITIPDNVKTIGESVFSDCSAATAITIGNGITTISNNAFYNCTAAASLSIGTGVTEIGNNAFINCSKLESIVIPSGVKTIGSSAFSGCTSATSVTIPDSVTSISTYAFQKCTSLTSVTIGSGVTSIGSNAFSGSGLTSVTFKTTDGWTVSTSSTDTGSSVTLTDESKNATLLKTTYASYYWKRT